MALGFALALALATGQRIAVMPIAAGEAISEKSAASLTQTLAAELRQQSGAPVITSRDLGSLLSLEKQKEMLGCTTDSCMTEIAGAAGADRVVSGDVAKLGESLVVQLRLLDARKASVVAQSHRRFKKGTFDDLLDALPAMVGELLQSTPAPAPKAAASQPAKGSSAPAAPATAPPASATAAGSAPAAAEGSFVLHYHREDGRYAGVELVTSEAVSARTFRQNARTPRGEARPRSSKPDGTDAFGVFWSIPTQPFPDGRVSFGIRLPEGWDECTMERKVGEPLSWSLAEGREAWQRVPGCALRTRP